MRRTTPVLLSLGALLATSAWLAPIAASATPAATPAAGAVTAPAGWKAVSPAQLASGAQHTDTRRAPLAQGDASVQADETELLAMQSIVSGKYVSTEKSYPAPDTGVLRARSAAYSGSWEGFAFEWDEAGQTYALKSLANDRYVSVEKNYSGKTQNELRARSTTAGGWEHFVLYYNEDLDRYALQSTLNGLFVSVEKNYTGTLQYALRARSSVISGSWEEFNLYSLEA